MGSGRRQGWRPVEEAALLRPGRVGGPREREVGNGEGEQGRICLPRTLGSRLRDMAWRYPWRCSRFETVQGVDKKSELSKLPGRTGRTTPHTWEGAAPV